MDGKFTQSTKDRLADQAGNMCSAPWCDRSTSAASGSRSSGVSNTAETAHIRARRAGTARWDPNMTDDERADISNGIHLCEDHAKLIDNDESLYTVDLLLRWKERQTDLAIQAQRSGWAFAFVEGLVQHSCAWAVSPTRDISADGVHDFIRAVGSSSVWDSDAADDLGTLMTELALNAARHAGATEVTLSSRSQEISLSYDEGVELFGLSQLRSSVKGRGGQTFLEIWSKKWGQHFLLLSESRGGQRVWTVRNLAVAPVAGAACAVSLERDARGNFDSTGLEGCDLAQIHLVGRWSFSDVASLVHRIRQVTEHTPVLLTSEHAHTVGLVGHWLAQGGIARESVQLWSDAALFEQATH